MLQNVKDSPPALIKKSRFIRHQLVCQRHASVHIFLGAAFTFSVTMIGTTMPTPLYPIYQDSFGFSDLMITIIFAAYAFGVFAALVLTGRWYC